MQTSNSQRRRRWAPCLVFAASVVFTSARGWTEETADGEKPDTLAGHSYHGEAFNEGPRQRAYLIGGTGAIKFPATTKNSEAQAFVEQGVGQLHGFWYFEAERSFRQAAALDPDCAIAYWGMAMANGGNQKRAKGFIAEAVKRKDGASDREKRYIDALDKYLKADPQKKKKERAQAIAKAYEQIVYDYPDDLEAKAFLGLQLWKNRSQGVPLTSHLAVDALLQDVIDEEPLHPSHHFRIHLWDYQKPERALDSAALCGQGSPSIAHMWHMPGHIYSRLKRYNDAAWQQEASARVDHAQMMRDMLLPDQIGNFAHNNEWLIRNLMNVGRVHDAIDLAKNMTELPRHPKYNTLKRRNSSYYGRLRLFDVLVKYELWEELVDLCHTAYLDETKDEAEQIKRMRYLGRAYFELAHTDEGKKQLDQLVERRDKIEAKKKTAIEKAEASTRGKERVAIAQAGAAAPPLPEAAGSPSPPVKKDKGDALKKKVEKARKDAAKPFDRRLRTIGQAVASLEAHHLISQEKYAEAVEKLGKAGRVDPLLMAHTRLAAGKVDEGLKPLKKYVGQHAKEVRPLVGLVDFLWKAERREEAIQEFEKLRQVASVSDLDVPLIMRVAPVAAHLEYGDKWTVPAETPADVGNRPDLDALGPFRWSPPRAEEWSLTDATGQSRSLSEFAGKPVVVIFYLGFGCLHCAEQLQAFGPKTDAFKEEGISLIAISTDNASDLKKSIDNYGKGTFPFPLLSDASLDVFKKYRVHDDFENQPLHGTFLIDGQGRIRWHDISFEPFMDPDFVLRESKRLLSQSAYQSRGVAAAEGEE